MSQNKFWMEITDQATARKAAMQGVVASGFVSVVTAIVSIGGWLGAGVASLVDSVLFAIVGFGIYKMSRAAAVIGLVLYLVERAYAMTQGHGGKVSFVVIFVTLCFIHSIRGTFAYHDMGGMEEAPTGGPTGPAGGIFRQ